MVASDPRNYEKFLWTKFRLLVQGLQCLYPACYEVMSQLFHCTIVCTWQNGILFKWAKFIITQRFDFCWSFAQQLMPTEYDKYNSVTEKLAEYLLLMPTEYDSKDSVTEKVTEFIHFAESLGRTSGTVTVIIFKCLKNKLLDKRHSRSSSSLDQFRWF